MAAPRRVPVPRPARRPLSDDDIVERITAAIVDHRLPPGTKLVEDRLGEVFGVSRTRVRQVLFRLAAEKVVTQRVNRGAFVASPSPAEARDVFDARRAIECELVRRTAARATVKTHGSLRELLARERAADAAADHRASIRLSGEFHQRIADEAGNVVLAEVLRELIARSSLIIALYGSPRDSTCEDDDHGALLAAIRRGDGKQAAEVMRQHLAHVEAALDLGGAAAAPPDLRAVFAASVA